MSIANTKNCYICPICEYYGSFESVKPESGERKYAQCPKCGSLERHRLQYLVFKEITKDADIKTMSMLHFSPENFFRNIFKTMFKTYVTADLNSKNVDRREDLTKLLISDNAFDFIYASHVLEHIKDDMSALSEINRVLKKNGTAIISVPVIGKYTIEYDKPNPHEYDHVRCPGDDYYERYKFFFTKIRIYKSTDFDEKYQPYVYEDRSSWPDTMPSRPSVPGEKHIETVPVCFK
ncbi:MAG: class I SAM-dependent methyltransferase [Candidatus Omnitrophica bacterium]|nr:class I SAM-dependent methyltransferase [Candidatus Omnitrophota bacterium]